MPERQSSPGEATASSEPEITQRVSTGTTERAGTETAPRSAPRPTPRPAPAGPQPGGDESPTVRTAPPRPGNGHPSHAHPGHTHPGDGHAGNGRGAGHPSNGHAAGGRAANGDVPNGRPGSGEARTVRAATQRPSPPGRPPAEPHPLADPRPPRARPRLDDLRPSGEENGSTAGQASGESTTVVVPVAPRSFDDAAATQALRHSSPPSTEEPATERMPAIAPRPPLPPADAPTRVGPGGPGDIDDGDRPTGSAGDRRPGRGRRRLLVLAAAVGALGLLYGGDLLLSSGSMPRGVTVAGIGVGGMSLADAESQLRSEIGARTAGPIPVNVGDSHGEIDPAAAGLSVDWKATLDRAASQPLNPITRITSFFSQR
jgi:hypothetical protein